MPFVLVVAAAWYIRFLNKTKDHPILLKDSAARAWYKKHIGGSSSAGTGDAYEEGAGNGNDQQHQPHDRNYYTSCSKIDDDDDDDDDADECDSSTGSDDDDDGDGDENDNEKSNTDGMKEEHDHDQGYYHPYNTPEEQNQLVFPVPLPEWFEVGARTAFEAVDAQVQEWRRDMKTLRHMDTSEIMDIVKSAVRSSIPKQLLQPIQPRTFFQRRRRRQRGEGDSESESNSNSSNASQAGNDNDDDNGSNTPKTSRVEIMEQRWEEWQLRVQCRRQDMHSNVTTKVTRLRRRFRNAASSRGNEDNDTKQGQAQGTSSNDNINIKGDVNVRQDEEQTEEEEMVAQKGATKDDHDSADEPLASPSIHENHNHHREPADDDDDDVRNGESRGAMAIETSRTFSSAPQTASTSTSPRTTPPRTPATLATTAMHSPATDAGPTPTQNKLSNTTGTSTSTSTNSSRLFSSLVSVEAATTTNTNSTSTFWQQRQRRRQRRNDESQL